MQSESFRSEIDGLYSSHHDWLRSWFYRRLGCNQAAADFTQDLFLRLIRRRKTLEAREPRAFLTTIAHGMLVDHWRRRDIERAWIESREALADMESPSAEEQSLYMDLLVQLDKRLDKLKPRTREAFLLAQLEGLTIPAIAKRLDVSRATIERDLVRAMKSCLLLNQEN